MIWGFFLLLLLIFFRREFPLRSLVRFGAVVALGFLLVVGPLAMATMKSPHFGAGYAKEQLLIFPEGREFQRTLENAASAEEAYRINLRRGLLVFNSPLHDHGYIYFNEGYAFVDPLTGLLLWVGLVILIFSRRRSPGRLLLAGGFLFLYFFYALVLAKNPNYTRYLLLLPFMAALAATALMPLTRIKVSKLPGLGGALFFMVITYIAAVNLTTYRHYHDKGVAEGHDIAATARHVDARRGIEGYAFYMAAGGDYPYYWWGIPAWWRDWFGFFASPQQTAIVLSPEQVTTTRFRRPFTVVMSQILWEKTSAALRARYGHLRVWRMKPDGSLLAIERN